MPETAYDRSIELQSDIAVQGECQHQGTTGLAHKDETVKQTISSLGNAMIEGEEIDSTIRGEITKIKASFDKIETHFVLGEEADIKRGKARADLMLFLLRLHQYTNTPDTTVSGRSEEEDQRCRSGQAEMNTKTCPSASASSASTTRTQFYDEFHRYLNITNRSTASFLCHLHALVAAAFDDDSMETRYDRMQSLLIDDFGIQSQEPLRLGDILRRLKNEDSGDSFVMPCAASNEHPGTMPTASWVNEDRDPWTDLDIFSSVFNVSVQQKDLGNTPSESRTVCQADCSKAAELQTKPASENPGTVAPTPQSPVGGELSVTSNASSIEMRPCEQAEQEIDPVELHSPVQKNFDQSSPISKDQLKQHMESAIKSLPTDVPWSDDGSTQNQKPEETPELSSSDQILSPERSASPEQSPSPEESPSSGKSPSPECSSSAPVLEACETFPSLNHNASVGSAEHALAKKQKIEVGLTSPKRSLHRLAKASIRWSIRTHLRFFDNVEDLDHNDFGPSSVRIESLVQKSIEIAPYTFSQTVIEQKAQEARDNGDQFDFTEDSDGDGSEGSAAGKEGSSSAMEAKEARMSREHMSSDN
ncbi:hypothetical protein BU24DRAFT_452763 [Aaosphaeria arxii CBS 175.79]|uniref:Uncharacterized protein n=1 Tax=Aaosphaeria arxii CBS 175.79 TaxID=1450172 RepID=A0A6A5XL37_9PLEO|nr:uncharacterized protein BU24DRAFT_452763 [Aaosphaeria arxii CBS 175.79]KAF2013985.1 hypothetical protein BU24DRAFT_452763 [Aaosphaeria arxii CBS 175.79]